MTKSKIGPVTAYADAVQAGYTGTREEFGRQQADFAKNAASVEQAKTEVNQTVAEFTQTTDVVKQDIITEGNRQIQRIEDVTPDLELDREQIASNTAGVEEAKAAAEEAKTIAKGRATGYVFDTVGDMETWLSVEENTQNLVLGDNLYIRATDVPDYWWDGEQAQPLETQKVDMEEYVKFTDYGKYDTPNLVIIQSNRSLARGVTLNSGYLELSRLYESEIKGKSSVSKCALMTSNIDMVSAQSAHQEMSNDYDPSTALTPDGGVPYAYGDRQPVSYAAVKKYIDELIAEQNYWENRDISQPDFEVTLEEDAAYLYIDKINGESFDWDEVMILANIASYTTGNSASGSPIYLQKTEGSTKTNSIKSRTYIPNENGVFFGILRKEFGKYVLYSCTDTLSNWSNGIGTIEKSLKTLFGYSSDFGDTINSLCINFGTSVGIPAGMHIRIYGKPARKGATS